MIPTNLNDRTLAEIQKLIEANFAGRDELYAAAESMDDQSRVQICRRLAEHLAANAAELQQVVRTCGVEPAGPLDMMAIAQAMFELAKSSRGESCVLDATAAGEEVLKQEYDQAIDLTSDQETRALLRKQRDQVEFSEDVLKNMKEASSDEPGPSKE